MGKSELSPGASAGSAGSGSSRQGSAGRSAFGNKRLRRLIGKKDSLRHRAASGSGWVFFRYVSNTGIRLVSNLILTRLLTPEIFGLLALARVFLRALKQMSDVGAKKSVIRSDRGDDPDFKRTAWTVSALRGLLIAVIACVIAWPASLLYEQPILFPLICTLSLSSVFGGLTTISAASLGRKIRLKQTVVLDTVTQLFTAVVTIGAAWAFESVWALAIGGVTGSLFGVVIGHLFLPPFKHRFQLEPEAFREIFSYGRWILLGTLFTFFGNKGRLAIQGFLVPVEVVGLISIASLIAWFPGELVNKFLGTIIFPAFSEIRRERPHDLPRVLRRVRLTMIFGVFPFFFATAYFAQPLIDLMYDDRYSAAGAILSVMALNSAIGMLGMPYQNLLLAEGRSGIHATLQFLYAGLGILGMFFGFWAGGFLGMFVGIAVGTVIHFLIVVGIALRRGHATWALDFVALAVVGLAYAYLLMTLELPPELQALGQS